MNDDAQTVAHGYEYISISWAGTSASGKTSIHSVEANSGGHLGEIKWFGRWRQYVFYPAFGTVYSAGCLEDIRDFIVGLKAARA
jgi:hypothetical protein